MNRREFSAAGPRRCAAGPSPVAGQAGFLQGFQIISNNLRIDALKIQQRTVKRVAERKQFVHEMTEPAMAVEEELDPGG